MKLQILTLRRWSRLLLALSVGGILTVYFQNCAPVGDATGSGVLSLSSASCDSRPAPVITGGPANQSVSVGMDNLSGTSLFRNLAVSVTPGYSGQLIELRCTVTGVNGLQSDCRDMNQVGVRLGDMAECLSGTATMTVRARDTLCMKDSNAHTFQIAVTNTCRPTVQVNPVANSETPQLDKFGAATAVSGNWAVVLASGDDEKGVNAGAAYVYQKSGSVWTKTQKLMPADLGDGDELGSVAISGSTIVLGAPFHNKEGTGVMPIHREGAAFVYHLNGSTWVEAYKISPSNVNTTTDEDLFGYSVAVSGQMIIVGAPGNNNQDIANYYEAGAAFVYQDNSSSSAQLGILRPSNLNRGDAFGAAVAASGIRVVVGAPSSNTVVKANYTGKAYVFTKVSEDFVEEKLEPTGLGAASDYGSSVANDGSRIAVGAISAKGNGNSTSGAVYIFNQGTNNLAYVEMTPKIFAPDGSAGDLFGYSVGLSGNGLVVGAPFNDLKTGAAYFYKINTSTNKYGSAYKLRPRIANRAEQDQFGFSVGLSESDFIGGSILDDDLGANMGSAFFIVMP